MTLSSKSVAGMFGPVTAPDGRGELDPTSVTAKAGGGRSKKLVDERELPDEYREAMGADHFVIYGRASVEREDEDGQVVDITALDDALPQLFKSGNISRRHKDVRVGEVLPEWELDRDVSIDIGEETLEFSAGDALETGANPDVVEEARGGSPGDDEFWLVADVWADSEIAKDTRLRSMSGDLNGFSVTIYAKETERAAEGETVTDVDFHAVTIGSDEQIKNKGSRYGVAEFKALFGGGPSAAAEAATNRLMFEGLLKKSAEETGFDGELLEAAARASEKAQGEDDTELKAAAEEAADGADFKSDDVLNTISVLKADTKAGDDMREVLVGVENGDLTAEEAMEMLGSGVPDEGAPPDPDEEMKQDDDTPPGDPGGDDEDEDDDYEDFDEKLDAALEERGVVTEDKLDDALDSQAARVGEKMEETIGEAVPDADDIAQKMDTGGTRSPSGGSGDDRVDYGDQIRQAAGAGGGE